MNIETAKAACVSMPQIEDLTARVALIDTAIAEKWPLTTIVAVAPAEGASSPAGTTISLVPPGKVASDENSQLALKTARETYAKALAALSAQLDAL